MVGVDDPPLRSLIFLTVSVEAANGLAPHVRLLGERQSLG